MHRAALTRRRAARRWTRSPSRNGSGAARSCPRGGTAYGPPTRLLFSEFLTKTRLSFDRCRSAERVADSVTPDTMLPGAQAEQIFVDHIMPTVLAAGECCERPVAVVLSGPPGAG